MALEILTTGPLTTVQDLGRSGYGKWGYRRCGACDKYAMQLANILAGNDVEADGTSGAAETGGFGTTGAPVLEFTLSGGKIRFTAECVIAVTGADMSPKLDGEPFSMYQPKAVRAGQILELGFAKDGLRTYLAVSGGLALLEVMGSCSTDATCGIGGLEGRALMAGDVIELLMERKENAGKQAVMKKNVQSYIEDIRGREQDFAITEEQFWVKQTAHPYRCVGSQLVPVMRVVPGPQEEAFTEAGKEMLWRGVYQVTADSNRMACKLEGPALETVKSSDIISDGIVEGSIQVAANGLPMVMLSDHQTTGGYAKIGTVISADISVIAQRKPGESIGFQYITPEEAGEAYRKEVRKLEWLKKEIIMKRKNRHL